MKIDMKNLVQHPTASFLLECCKSRLDFLCSIVIIFLQVTAVSFCHALASEIGLADDIFLIHLVFDESDLNANVPLDPLLFHYLLDEIVDDGFSFTV